MAEESHAVKNSVLGQAAWVYVLARPPTGCVTRATQLTSLCRHFLICKMGMITAPARRVAGKLECVNPIRTSHENNHQKCWLLLIISYNPHDTL